MISTKTKTGDDAKNLLDDFTTHVYPSTIDDDTMTNNDSFLYTPPKTMIAAWVLQNHPLGYRGNSPDCLYGVAFFHFATAKASVFEGGGLKTLFFTTFCI